MLSMKVISILSSIDIELLNSIDRLILGKIHICKLYDITFYSKIRVNNTFKKVIYYVKSVDIKDNKEIYDINQILNINNMVTIDIKKSNKYLKIIYEFITTKKKLIEAENKFGPFLNDYLEKYNQPIRECLWPELISKKLQL